MSKLYQKLALIQSQLKSIPESGRNPHFGYSYASVEDVLNAVRPICSKHGIFISITCLSHEILQNGRAASVIMQLTLTDIESGESVTSQCPGYSEDKADKALWKAISGGSKYLLRTFFCIASGGDDPEDEGEHMPNNGTASTNGKAHKPVTGNGNAAPAAPRPQPPRSSEPPAASDVNSLQRQAPSDPASPHNDNEQASMITATTHEMVRLNWSTAQGRLFLQEHFGKSTRKVLSPHELYQFLEHLRSQPSPPVPVPS